MEAFCKTGVEKLKGKMLLYYVYEYYSNEENEIYIMVGRSNLI